MYYGAHENVMVCPPASKSEGWVAPQHGDPVTARLEREVIGEAVLLSPSRTMAVYSSTRSNPWDTSYACLCSSVRSASVTDLPLDQALVVAAPPLAAIAAKALRASRRP